MQTVNRNNGIDATHDGGEYFYGARFGSRAVRFLSLPRGVDILAVSSMCKKMSQNNTQSHAERVLRKHATGFVKPDSSGLDPAIHEGGDRFLPPWLRGKWRAKRDEGGCDGWAWYRCRE